MSFRKDAQEVAAAQSMMSKNIIVTNNDHWTTEEIILASLDRTKIEKLFRAPKTQA
jgi:hypothetical protein